MKICFLIRALDYGGAERQLLPPEPRRSTGSSSDRESSHKGTAWRAEQGAAYSRQSHDCSL